MQQRAAERRVLNKDQRQVQQSFTGDAGTLTLGGDLDERNGGFAMRRPKIIALALAASLASGVLVAKASATPVNGMAAISQQVAGEVQQVRWGWHRHWAWHRWGWHRHWGWHRWGWHRHWA
jgi:hypothetical protein